MVCVCVLVIPPQKGTMALASYHLALPALSRTSYISTIRLTRLRINYASLNCML